MTTGGLDPTPPDPGAATLADDLRYLFELQRIEREPDGTFTLYAPRDSGRSVYRVSAERMYAIVDTKWPHPASHGATEPNLLAQMLTRRDGSSYVPVADVERYLATEGATSPGARVDVEAIRARADAATPGPWNVDKDRGGFWHGRFAVVCHDGIWRDREYAGERSTEPRILLTLNGNFEPGEDAAFIAHARADVPALCDALTHERRVSAIWRDLALARIAPAAAFAQLRALGIDPVGP